MLEPFTSESFWFAVMQSAGPLCLAALGALICSRAGVLFVGVEGTLLGGVFFSIAGTVWTGSLLLGIVLGAAAGTTIALIFGLLSMELRMGDIIGGLVVQITALGVFAFLQQELFPDGQTIGNQRLEAPWPSFGGAVGEVLFHQNLLLYGAILAAVAIHFFLRTKWGLRVRASGESLTAATSFGVPLRRVRYASLAAGGLLTGLGGAVLGLAVVGTFSTNTVNGRGFIALACVMLAAWRPIPVLGAAFLFASAEAYGYQVDNAAIGDSVKLLPYVLTLVAIGVFWGRRSGPAEEGRGLPAGE
jgi:simple sugar transport system permease protein